MSRKRLLFIVLSLLVSGGAVAAYLYTNRSGSNDYIHRWLREPSSRPKLITALDEPCPGAPFLLPSQGLIGLLWRDSAAPYNLLRRHTGVDIFGDGEPGTVPVFAAYDGYLTRRDDWLSSVIIRHDDPLQPGRTIWTYYTHMADREGTTSFVAEQFPPGTSDQFVEQGTLLGHQGEYNGDAVPIAMHVHVSIVTSEVDGSFKNEAALGNTLDPSPYFGLSLNLDDHPERPIRC